MSRIRYKEQPDCTGARSKRHRGAFSLVELVVSIGVLVLMLALAGQVMSFTVRSTGQAKALTEVNQQFRVLQRTLREDLRYVQPGSSVLLIQGNPVNAYWTTAGRDADNNGDPNDGYPHARDPEREDPAGNLVRPRADMLMVFAARKARSTVNPEVTSEVQQVVYGHAVLGEYVPNPAGGPDPYVFEEGPLAFPTNAANALSPHVDPDETSLVPARLWHLARRSVLLLPKTFPGGLNWADDPVDRDGLDDEDILASGEDILGDFSYEYNVLLPSGAGVTGVSPLYWPQVFDYDAVPFARSRLDPTPPAPMAHRLGHYFLSNCASFRVEWTLAPRSEFVAGRLAGENEVYWFDPGDLGDPIGSGSQINPLRSLENAIAAAGEAGDIEREDRLDALLTHLLGGRYDASASAPDGRYSLGGRFQSNGPPEWREHPYGDGRPNLVVFGATRMSPSGEFIAEEIFPSALKITVDLFDDAGRLERPIRHVMIVPVGR